MDMEAHLAGRRYDLWRYPTQWLAGAQLTVPLFDFGGRLTGYQVYSPLADKKADNPKAQRYFTRMSGNVQAVWGLELPVSVGSTVFLTESVFKSAAVHRAGFNSWSVLGSSVSPQLRQQLSLLPYLFVCLGDDDSAGLAFSKTFAAGAVSQDLDEMALPDLKALLHSFDRTKAQ